MFSIARLLLMVVFVFSSLPAMAQDAPASAPPAKTAAPPLPQTTVDMVQVDASGKSAAEAKDIAIRQGTQDAFKQLIHKLYPDYAVAIAAKLKPEQIEALVQKKQVENEKITGTHYEGVLTYRFDPQQVAALAKAAMPSPAQEISEAALNSRSVLLLPVLKFNDTVQLWEDENSWRKSWNHIALQIGRGQIIVPYGDRRDREEIGTEETLIGDFKDFASIADRYGVKEVYIAIAEYQSSDLSRGVQILIRKLSAAGTTTEEMKFDAVERETRDQQLERVAREMARKLTKIKGVTPEAYQSTRDNEITVDLTYDGFKEFQKICDMLRAIPSVRHMHVNSSSYYEGAVTLYYRTSPELLGKSFAAQGFRIYKKGDSLILALPQ